MYRLNILVAWNICIFSPKWRVSFVDFIIYGLNISKLRVIFIRKTFQHNSHHLTQHNKASIVFKAVNE